MTAQLLDSSVLDSSVRQHLSHGRRRRRRTAAVAVALTGGVAVGLLLTLGAAVRADDATAADRGGTTAPVPPATGLDPEVTARFERAREEARRDGVDLTLTSGWRSVGEQQRLLDEAVARDGLEEAHRTVLPPERSAHVAGTAIDVGPREGAAWLEEHQVQIGLCRTYANEWWHFELVGEPGQQCPAMLPDASHGWS